MPLNRRRSGGRNQVAQIMQLIGAMKSANFQPTLNSGVGASEGGVDLDIPLSYASPTSGENFWSGNRAQEQVTGLNQQLLMQRLREQAQVAQARALRDYELQSTKDLQFQQRGDYETQLNDLNLGRLRSNSPPIERPLYNPTDNKLLQPSKILADTSSNQLLDTQNRAIIPGAREAAIAKQGSERNIDLEKGLGAFQRTNAMLDRPDITPSNFVGENEKMSLGNEAQKLRNIQSKAEIDTGFTTLGPNFLFKGNRPFSVVPGTRAESLAPNIDPVTKKMTLAHKAATPDTLKEVPNPSVSNDSTQSLETFMQNLPPIDQLPPVLPGETKEQYRARVFPGK